ncbi:MAG: 50S ribosomal protein L25 [Actinomycetota bacterium]
MPTALKAQVGRALGSAAARRLLSQDQIPAVVYGHGMTPLAVTVDRKDLRVALSGPAGLNTVLELHVGADKYPAIVKEVQRDPVKRNVRHVDFQQISMTETITVHVPLHVKGTAKAVLAEGGLVDPVANSIDVRATAANIPNEIVVDITNMTMDSVVRLGDLQMPAGVTVVGDPEFVVITVVTTKVEEVAPVAAAAAEGEAGAEGAAGEGAVAEGAAPADGDAAKAAGAKPAAGGKPSK